MKWIVAFFIIICSIAAFSDNEQLFLVGYKNQEIPHEVDVVIRDLSLKYGANNQDLNPKLLRSFLYTIIHRESSFEPSFCNEYDQINTSENWAQSKPASTWPTKDHSPHGCGLTQITGWNHGGMPYPNNSLNIPKILNKGIYGKIAPRIKVSPMGNPLDPRQNIERFLTEHVLPMFTLVKKRFPNYTNDELLRVIAFHWNKGDYIQYNPDDYSYLNLYDAYYDYYKKLVNDDSWPTGKVSEKSTSETKIKKKAILPTRTSPSTVCKEVKNPPPVTNSGWDKWTSSVTDVLTNIKDYIKKPVLTQNKR